MKLRELYSEGTERLDEEGIDSPSVDAFWLLEYITGQNRSLYLLNKEREVQPEAEKAYMDLIEKRAGHVPCQYLTGTADFMGYTISVNEKVLIPRLDTEVLAEEALKLIPNGGSVLDMCTGSGCIAVALKKLRPDAKLCAADISEDALLTAEKNAEANEAEIRFFQSNLFEKMQGEMFDLIVSNPPYVTEEEYESLMPEVREHEPKLALTAGREGLDIYVRLIPEAFSHLNAEGHLALEIGCSQADAVTALMDQAGFTEIKTIKDLCGLSRVVTGKKNV